MHNDLGSLAITQHESLLLEEDWPCDGLEEVPNCPVCSCEPRDLIHRGLTDTVFRCAPGKWTCYRCRNCRTVYLDPRPTAKTIGIAYKRYFTHSMCSDIGSRVNPIKKFRQAIATGYRNRRFAMNPPPISILGSWLSFLLPAKRAQWNAEGRHLDRAMTGKRLLDVGCGNGDFLVFARNMGWTVEGLDADMVAVQVAKSRGIKVHHGDIEIFVNEKECFDAITIAHVLEHVHDPLALLTACYRLLKTDGMLWLETPNIDSVGYRTYGPNWRGLEPPRHLVLFNESSLFLALSKVGFNHIEVPRPRRVALQSFAKSEAISRHEDPYQSLHYSVGLRFRAWCADKCAARDSAQGENLNLVARKLVVQNGN